jgi:hypothetical protein
MGGQEYKNQIVLGRETYLHWIGKRREACMYQTQNDDKRKRKREYRKRRHTPLKE